MHIPVQFCQFILFIVYVALLKCSKKDEDIRHITYDIAKFLLSNNIDLNIIL